jgi:hypothetical protein
MENMKSKLTVYFKDGQTFEYSHRNNAPINAMSGLQGALKAHLKVELSDLYSNVSKIVMDREVK